MNTAQAIAFRAPRDTLPGLDASAVEGLVRASGDVALVVGGDGRIVDAAFEHGDPTGVGHDGWIGRGWLETVTAESRTKISEMLADAANGVAPRWRQVNHPSASGDVPVRYLAVRAGSGVVAVGQDLRAMAAMQQRLIQAQQSLERDYLRLRNAEGRYRLLFDLGREAVLIVDADTRRIAEANPAAAALAGAKPGALINRSLTAIIDPADQDDVIAHLGAVSATTASVPLVVRLARDGSTVALTATAFRQDRAGFFLIGLQSTEAAALSGTSARMLDAVERLPDAFVLADRDLAIIATNAAFVDLAQEASAARLTGASLGGYLGRAGIDTDLIVDQLRAHGSVRNVATIMRGRLGAIEEVEVAAVAVPGNDGDAYGFSIRGVGRRVRDLPPVQRDLPRSVEQLTELVGRMPLKDIVRESTDLIERLCIEAALKYTSDNRASAAEVLGVSRQSLYSKLHRHGLGNLVGGEE